MPLAADIPPVIAVWQREALTPVAASERMETLDVLRGFALFGILTVNIIGFSWPADLMMMREYFWESRTDVIADRIVQFLAEGKFYPLFAFLFGLGAAIQMERAETRGANFTGRYCRRLSVLFVFGLGHALLVWEGDILLWYVVCGFLLLPFRKRQPRTLLIWAAVGLLVPVLLTLLLWALLAGLSLVPEAATEIQKGLAQDPEIITAQLEETIRVFSQGSYGEIFAARFENLIYMWLVGICYVPGFFGMFLLGLYAGKRRIFADIEGNVGLIRRILVWGLIIGLPANAIYTIGMAVSDMSDARFLWLLSHAFVGIGGPVQALAYAAAIALLLRRDRWKRWLRTVAAAGQMALSNYLLQSLLCTTIFYSYGLGLFGSVGRTTGLALVVVIYAGQVVFSVWWLKRFQFGPMEWLWRTLTYGKRQPLRR